MVLENNEYRVKEMDGLQTITITKEALEKWRDHYDENAMEYINNRKFGHFHGRYGYFLGKRDVLADLLKMFEELEG